MLSAFLECIQQTGSKYKTRDTTHSTSKTELSSQQTMRKCKKKNPLRNSNEVQNKNAKKKLPGINLL